MKSLKDYLFEGKVSHNQNSMTFACDGSVLAYNDFVVTVPIPPVDAFELSTISVTDRGKKIGVELVKAFIEFAKKEGKDIVLYASPMEEEASTRKLTDKQLIDWYKKLGFETYSKYDSSVTDEHCMIYKVA